MRICICERCGKKMGSIEDAYEKHHMQTLVDHADNTIDLCPNCYNIFTDRFLKGLNIGKSDSDIKTLKDKIKDASFERLNSDETMVYLDHVLEIIDEVFGNK